MRNNLGQLKLLIIDEISLVGANMLYRIHLRLSDTFQTDETKVPFGGINVMLVGDLLQLPPIRQSQVFQSPEDKHCQGLEKAKPLWNELTPMILKHNHRQGKDGAWAESLNRFREGIVSEEDVEVLKSRMIPDSLLKESATHIFYENRHVVAHDEKMLKTLDGNIIEQKATQALPKGCKSNIKLNKGTIGDTDFKETLRFKIGARVMLTYNLDLMDDLYNGAIGKVIGVENDKKGQVYCIIVQFEEESVGVQHSQKNFAKYPVLKGKYGKMNATPIFKKELKFKLGKSGWRGASEGRLLQFPLTTNYATTGHKSQVISMIYLFIYKFYNLISKNLIYLL